MCLCTFCCVLAILKSFLRLAEVFCLNFPFLPEGLLSGRTAGGEQNTHTAQTNPIRTRGSTHRVSREADIPDLVVLSSSLVLASSFYPFSWFSSRYSLFVCAGVDIDRLTKYQCRACRLGDARTTTLRASSWGSEVIVVSTRRKSADTIRTPHTSQVNPEIMPLEEVQRSNAGCGCIWMAAPWYGRLCR